MQQLIIGFNGGYGSGKSTAVDALKSHNVGAVCVVKFAQPLYDIQNFIYRRIAPVYQPSVDFSKDRVLLQFIGTDWGRNSISETLWVDLWKARVKEIQSRDPSVHIVCDDVRFDNEAQAIQSLGGFIVKINRPDNGAHALGGTGIKNHASEAGISPEYVDYILNNHGSLEDFQEALRTLFGEIKAEQAA